VLDGGLREARPSAWIELQDGKMDVLKNEICEFCGKKRKWLSSNAIHGYYCEDCLRNARKEDATSLASIRIARHDENAGGKKRK